jgi:hypothetical protein
VAPTGVNATDILCTGVQIDWAYTGNPDSFHVLRNNTRIAGVAGSVRQYFDSSAVVGQRYQYKVKTWQCIGVVSVPDSGGRGDVGTVAGVSATDNQYCDSVVVTWNNITGEDSFRVKRDGGEIGRTLADILRFRDTTAAAGVRYAYTVEAHSSCGWGATSLPDSGSRRALPRRVSYMYATEDNCDSVFITWAAQSNTDSFKVFRDGGRIGAVSGSIQSFVDRLGTAGVRYGYSVAAWNTCGDTLASLVDSGWRLVFPSVPQSVTATNNLCDRIIVTWRASSGDVDNYAINRDGSLLATIAGTDTTYNDSTCTVGQHTYRITAVSQQCGSTNASDPATGERRTVPNQVTGVAATNGTLCEGVLVTWNDVERENGFEVLRNSSPVGSTPADCLAFLDQTGAPGLPYDYAVRAFNVCGPGAPSGSVLGMRLWQGLHVSSPNGGEVLQLYGLDTLRWTSCGDITSLTIELKRDYPSGSWETLAESTTNDGVEILTITGPPSDHCRIRITGHPGEVSDTSDADFRLTTSQGFLALVRLSAPSTPVVAWDAGTIECPQNQSEAFRFKNFGSGSIVVFQPLEPPSAEFSRTTNSPPFFALAPGQMSTYQITLNFNPVSAGTFRDTLQMQSDAINGQNGMVKIPLSGSQIRTPAVPRLVITTNSSDAVLHWNRIAQSVGNCPVAVTRYLVFISETFDGPFWYHGSTADTNYTHIEAVLYTLSMYYHVRALAAPPALIEALPEPGDGHVITEERLLEWLEQSDHRTTPGPLRP